MPRSVYCWRCGIEVPMLDETEWAVIAPHMHKAMQDTKSYRESTGSSLPPATFKEFRQAALDRYEQMTGFAESNFDALWHHRLADLGPPCGKCGKPYRTKIARFCAECGDVPTNTEMA